MRETYALLLDKQYFHFSCAHFLIFPDGRKERLHGHNYRLSCRLEAALGPSGLVLDFGEVKPVIRGLCDDLDEHYLLPVAHPEIRHRLDDAGHIHWSYRACRYQAPVDEVLLLPLNNISVENLARWCAHELWRRLGEAHPDLVLCHIEVAVAETPGQSGVYRIAAEGAGTPAAGMPLPGPGAL